MPDTVKRLSGPTQLTTTAVNQYSVPAATSTVLRNLHAQNTSAAAVTLFVSVGTTGIDTDASRIFAVSIPASSVLDWSGFIVVPTGEFITAKASAATSLVLYLSGVEVT